MVLTTSIKRSFFVAFFAMLALFTASKAHAQKLAIIDIQQVVAESKAGKTATSTLKKDADSAIKQVQTKGAEFKKLEDDFKKQQNSLSQQALQNKQMELNRKAVELDRLQKDLQADIQQKEAIALEDVIKQLEPVIKDYAKEKGFDIIMPKQAIIYNSDNIDITKDIISRFDIKWSKKGK